MHHAATRRCSPPTARFKLIALALAAFSAAPPAAAQLMLPGILAGGAYSAALGVNADGSVVVGMSDSAAGTRAFRWTAAGGMQSLGVLANGHNSLALAVNDNGSVVVGQSETATDAQAFRWTQAGGMQSLGTLPGGGESQANRVSADGSVVVGFARDNGGQVRAFRWTSVGGMADLGFLAGGNRSEAYGVNSDGSVVVGMSASAAGNRAFRWTAGVMQNLGVLAGGSSSLAYAVNGDGSVIVGQSHSTDGTRAFRWTQAGGMVNLGTLPGGTTSNAISVSRDGAVVVGTSIQSGDHLAFRWTAASGMHSVASWLSAAGVTVAPGFVLNEALAISADGSTIVGNGGIGGGYETFIARVAPVAPVVPPTPPTPTTTPTTTTTPLPPTASGAIALSEVQRSLDTAANGGGMALASGNTLINGAHSRPLMRRVAAGQNTFWVAGDWGTDDHGERNGSLGLAEFGLGRNFGLVQFNLSLGQTWSNQSLTSGSHATHNGTFLLAEALLPVSGNLWATVGAYGNQGKADLRRGYLNAGSPDASRGKPGVDTFGLRARLDWDNAANLLGSDFSPYFDVNYSKTKLAAYRETDGGFPAYFNARTDKATELHLGVNAVRPLFGNTNLVTTLEATHRIEKTGARTSGQMLGLFSFDFAGARNQRDWLRAGLGFDSKLAGGTASLMLNATSKGEMPNLWLAANWQMAF